MLHPNPSILDITPYVGGDVTPPGMFRRIVLASNENPFGPSPNVLSFLNNFSLNLASYPSGHPKKLKDAIALSHHLEKERIICGNGSEDLIHLICRAYATKGDEIIMPQYGFLVYSIGAKSVGATCVCVPQPSLTTNVNRLLSLITPRTRIVFLDNPGNPLGCMLPATEVKRLADQLPDHVLLVLDEAYAEFVEDPTFESGLTLLKDYPNVVVLRTFSKVYGLAGLRLGFGYGAVDVLNILHRIRPPFNVNSIAQAAGVIALHDQSWVKRVKNHTLSTLYWTKEKMEALGFSVQPGFGNFLLFDCATRERAADIYAYLGRRGIMIRPVNGYGLFQYLRVSMGKTEEMEEFIDLLEAYTREFPL